MSIKSVHKFIIKTIKNIKPAIKVFMINGISQKYHYYRKPFEDQSENDMPELRPIGDLNILPRRPTCRIEDRHARSEIDMPQRKPTSPVNDPHAFGDPTKADTPAKSKRNLNNYIYFLLIYIGIM